MLARAGPEPARGDVEAMAAGLPGPRRAPASHWAGPGAVLTQVPHRTEAGATTGRPVIDSVAGLALVGDIRLDNRAELLAALGADGPAEAGDPGLVLAAYRRWGDRCVERLFGDFAFALVDLRRHSVVCARDAFGTQPLYYQLSPSTFAFASGPEAILRLASVPRQLDPLAVADYLYACFEDTEVSPWIGIARLPPGSVLVVEPDRVSKRRFWRPEAVPELSLSSDAEYEEAFRVALHDSVRGRLAPAATGVYLSGGLDSSSVACVAQPLHPEGPLPTFSAVFDLDPSSDERTYAAAVAAAAGAAARYCRPEGTSPLADWEAAPWTGPAPSCNPQVGVFRAVTEAATDQGVSVLLSGFGGDSVVSHGVAYLTELAGSGHPLRFLAEAKALARRHHRPLARVVRSYGLRPFVPQAMLGTIRPGAMGHDDSRVGGTWAPVRQDVVRDLRLVERAAALGRPRRQPRTARLAHLADLASGVPAAVFEDSFHADAVVGVERRYPFMDRRLAELCVSLPGDQKLRDGWTRSIMRRALAGVLPEVVRLRPGKGDLSPAFSRALLGRDRAALEDLVAQPGRVAEWVDPGALSTLWQRCLQQRRSDDCFTLWRVAVLSRWLDHHGFG